MRPPDQHDRSHLHVVESVEGFAADGAGELRRADKDLRRRRDPVLAFNVNIAVTYVVVVVAT